MSLRPRLPSLGALSMFEAAARHSNFTAAAREFNVTQPAISRMVARLEQHLSARLFLRHTRGLELTPEGVLLFRALSDGFGRIEAAIDEIESRNRNPEVVTFSLTSAMALHWLIPRLDQFKRDLPKINLRLDIMHGEPHGPIGAADLALRYNMPAGDDIDSCPLDAEQVIPVCSPAYLAAHGMIDGPEGMKGQVLASLTGRMRIPWARYSEVMELSPVGAASELSFSDYALVIQGAIKGQGIALGWWHVVASEVLSGGLVPASQRCLVTGADYHLVARRSTLQRASVGKVRSWLLQQFAAMEVARQGLGLTAVFMDDRSASAG